ncbi:5-formyltetrahydrofolate cyclo-ligase [Aliivibrio kagoshimensis]|uniref:5-formyltetrahydrofolate cyclo-ligase n=1 Tax=Aliivibrio kagoshimensis TaxID=2910230 RepID=UPI003D10EC8C
MKPSTKLIRKTIRDNRRALTPDAQLSAAKQLLTRFIQLPEVINAKSVALYLSVDGEIDTTILIEWLWSHNKEVYLPVLHPFNPGNLLFLRYLPDTEMRLNKYNIKEPHLNVLSVIPTQEIDLICAPLVAFDAQGNRLGMGGGYYDRTLSIWHQKKQGPKPVGLAHDCQQTQSIPVESWDVPLPHILTPSKHWHWPSLLLNSNK